MANHGTLYKRENPFIQLDKTIINDTRLSWKATGLITYFVSKPNGWKFNLDHIIKSKTDGEKSVRAGINELKEHGYIVRVAFRKNGKVCDYEFFVYEVPVKYPTKKDLHIDKDLWEKYKKSKGENAFIDITVAAQEIKKLKEEMKSEQVSQNGKPEKNQGIEQVSQNGKPEKNQGIEQVSDFQNPEKQDPEKEGLSITNLYISKINNNYDDDPYYLTLRILFTQNGGQDIKRHDMHYPKFKEALNHIGSFEEMLDIAKSYINACHNGYHAKPQIVWFLSDGWRNFQGTKINKFVRRGSQQQKQIEKQKTSHLPKTIEEQAQMNEEKTTSSDNEYLQSIKEGLLKMGYADKAKELM
ncbi:hypothetical protein NYE37_13855 [Thermoactinomyces sp. FSL K6-2592]|uniref:hypothetical protein n=1 Tax=Thermoactinomyces sp. FSL K6-2592 TaxID=2975347 RepID=UPI0030F5F91B